jgi:glycosyltransferase involved in cell wall biosynthesis
MTVDRSLKIVMICDFYDPDLEYQENLLAKYYAKHGHRVTIVASHIRDVFEFVAERRPGRRSAERANIEHATLIRLPYRFNLLNRLRAYPDLTSILTAEAPDLIYFHDVTPNLLEAVRYVKARPEVRMILDCHADLSNSGANWASRRILHGVIRKAFLDRARPYLSRIFPVVPASFSFLETLYKVAPTEMELLPLGTDTDFGAQVMARREGEGVRRALGIGSGAMVVFTGGKLTPAKKTEAVIAAVRQLDAWDVHLIVVGDSGAADQDYRSRLTEAAAGCDRIHFVGWQNKIDLYRHLDAADVAVFPASQSVLWQQSIGMGLPLIVSESSRDTHGRQDVSYLNLYENVTILSSQEPLDDQILQHLCRLAEDKNLRHRMSAGAKRVTSELLDYNRIVRQTIRFNALESTLGAAVE